MKILAVDLGDKWVGLAISNSELTISMPMDTMDIDTFKQKICKICKDYQITQIVYGMPLTSGGHPSRQSGKIEIQVKELQNILLSAQITVTWHGFDERFTSYAAQTILLEQNMKLRNHKQKEHAIAASILLETFLRQLNCAYTKQ